MKLEWEETHIISTDDDNGPLEGKRHWLKAWESLSYTIVRQRGTDGIFILRGLNTGVGFASPSLKNCKARAQADYDARITLETAGVAKPATPNTDEIAAKLRRGLASDPPSLTFSFNDIEALLEEREALKDAEGKRADLWRKNRELHSELNVRSATIETMRIDAKRPNPPVTQAMVERAARAVWFADWETFDEAKAENNADYQWKLEKSRLALEAALNGDSND
jgi:hypothetical protein